jgi:hypothetical protein
VSGGAQGADRLGERYARQRGLKLLILKPDWHPRSRGGRYDPGAGLKRNGDIVAQADYVLAFYDGESPGTKNTIARVRESGKDYQVVRFDKPKPIVHKQAPVPTNA